MRLLMRLPTVRVPRCAAPSVPSTASAWDSFASFVKLEIGTKNLAEVSMPVGSRLERGCHVLWVAQFKFPHMVRACSVEGVYAVEKPAYPAGSTFNLAWPVTNQLLG